MSSTTPPILWRHPDPKSTKMYRLMQHLNKTESLNLTTFTDLATWSSSNRNAFYTHLFHFLGFLYTGSFTRAVDETKGIHEVPAWFEGVNLNFAENMLYSSGLCSSDAPSCDASKKGIVGKESDKVAIISVREGGEDIKKVTFGELRTLAGKLAGVLAAKGVKKGDRVLAAGANSVEMLTLYLAVQWLGALFSSVATDMGVEAVVQRAKLIDPKFIFCDDAAVYNGKTIDLRSNITAIQAAVTNNSTTPSFTNLVVIPRFSKPYDISKIPQTITFADFQSLQTCIPAFVHLPFDSPSVIYYSSGTTGPPKAIVHSIGGILINILKEGTLHEYRDEHSTALQFTTTGWIMYLGAVAPILFGGCAVLYDGSPLFPKRTILLELIEKFKINKLGVGPRWMSELAKNNIIPTKVANLSSLQVVTSTGMILPDDLFKWFYSPLGFPSTTHLANLSGGTDIIGCFGLENPLDPVYLGGTQNTALGIKIAVFNSSLPHGALSTTSTKDSREITDGSPGELVATVAFPNTPRFLWGDSTALNAPGPKYKKSYFERYPGVWAHGDFVTIHPVTGGLYFLGRSDGVLNPSGIRFGSAEIYNIIDRYFASSIADSVCVGRRRTGDIDERVMLFVVMKPGVSFTDALRKEIKREIGTRLSKRHVPSFIFAVPEIPVTANGKKVEVVVKRIVSGLGMGQGAGGGLANANCLEYFERFIKVENDNDTFKGKF